MKAHSSLSLLILCAIHICACNNEITVDPSFEQICIASGGQFDDEVCICGTYKDSNNEVIKRKCAQGVICQGEDDNLDCAGDGHPDTPEPEIVQCEGNETKCENSANGGSLYKCINGSWEKSENCAGGHSCTFEYESSDDENSLLTKSSCGKCKDGERACKDNENHVGIRTFCVNGQIQTDIRCPGDVSCAGDTCGECKTGDTMCTNNSEFIGEFKRCEHGKWSKAAQCDHDYSCESTTECGKCQNNAIKCEDGAYWTCSNANWLKTGLECTDSSCNPQETPQRCVEKNKTVEGVTSKVGYIETCVNGEFRENETKSCTGDMPCNEDGTDCKAECSPHELRCYDNNNKQECTDDGHWGESIQCDDNQSCSKGKCDNTVCTDDTKKCNNDVLYICKNNVWVKDKKCDVAGCDSDAAPSAELGCYDCADGSSACNGNAIQKCDNHQWKEEKCNEPLVCEDGECRCQNNQCQTDSKTNIGKLQTCIDGALGSPISCQNNVSCHDNQCGDCQNGTRVQNAFIEGGRIKSPSSLDQGTYTLTTLLRFKNCSNGTTDASNWNYCQYGSADIKSCNTYTAHVREIFNGDKNGTYINPWPQGSKGSVLWVPNGLRLIVYGQTNEVSNTSTNNNTWQLVKIDIQPFSYFPAYTHGWIRTSLPNVDPSKYTDRTNESTFIATLDDFEKNNCMGIIQPKASNTKVWLIGNENTDPYTTSIDSRRYIKSFVRGTLGGENIKYYRKDIQITSEAPVKLSNIEGIKFYEIIYKDQIGYVNASDVTEISSDCISLKGDF